MKNKKNIIFNKGTTILFKIVIPISMFFLTFILCNYLKDEKNNLMWIFINSLSSLLILLLILFFNKKIIKINKKKLLISFFISSYSMNYFLNVNINKIIEIFDELIIDRKLIFVLGLLGLPACMLFVYLFIEKLFPKIKKFFIKMDKVEKMYLYIVGICGIIITTYLVINTTAFTKPNYNGNSWIPDIIYTTDSGLLTNGDAFINFSHGENDIRQPLFGLFSYPFSIVGHLLGNCLFLQNGQNYFGVMVMIQILLNAITTIMLARLLKLKDKYKIYFYLLFTASFSYMLFNFVLEQYSIALFYLILTIYVSFNSKGINYSYIGATGTLLTSGIIFPLITKFKTLKQWIKDVWKCFLAFVTCMIFSGQFIQIVNLNNQIAKLSEFAGQVSLQDRLYRFSNFVCSIFFATPGRIQNQSTKLAYNLIIPDKINYIGVIIFALLIISFIINRKEKIARISFLWMIFSVILLIVGGWGQPENGLILYSLYFAWAYLILYFLLLKKLLKNKKIFEIAIVITIIIMFFYNLCELARIFTFAINYY